MPDEKTIRDYIKEFFIGGEEPITDIEAYPELKKAITEQGLSPTVVYNTALQNDYTYSASSIEQAIKWGIYAALAAVGLRSLVGLFRKFKEPKLTKKQI